MTKFLEGMVTKAVGGVFTVFADKKYLCLGPKKLRYFEMDILVGDRVQFSLFAEGRGIIEKVLPRKNRFKRPEVANIDIVFVMVAILPEPDLLLADKIIVNCFREKITPVVVLNKCDLPCVEFLNSLKTQYKNVCDVVAISAANGDGVEALKAYFKDNVVCLAGQSAVGKTSLLNCFIENLNKEVGGLSQKISRGRHTTRYSQIFPIFDGYIVDTTGFSLLEVSSDINSRDLMLYYDDMVEVSNECKFKMCTHTVEPDCAVKNAVEMGTINSERYQRYLEIFKQLTEFEKNKY